MAIEAGTQTLETESDDKYMPQVRHWETHRQSSEAGVEVANKNLARLAMITSGQLQLELPVSEEALL